MDKSISKSANIIKLFVYICTFMMLVISPKTWAASTDLSLSGSYSSSTIGNGGVSSLTLVLDNQTGLPLREIGFSVTIPDDTYLAFADPINFSTSCSNGNYTFDTTTFTAADYTLAPGESCNFMFDMAASGVASLSVLDLDVTGLSSSEGVGSNPAGPIQLSVDPNYVSISMSVLNDKLSVESVNTLTVSMANLPLFFGDFYRVPFGTINLPDDVVLASPLNYSSNCGANFVNGNASGANSFAIPGSYADSSACSFSFDVVASSPGVKNIVSGEITDPAISRTIGKISASYVSELSFITAKFSPSALVPGGSGAIEVSIFNSDRSNAATNISFTADLNSALAGLVSSGDLSDVCGAGSSLSGSGVLSFSGGSLAAGASCQFNINIDVPVAAVPGSYVNTISAISYQLNGQTQTPDNSTSSFTVNSAPSIALRTLQSGSPSTSVAAGEVISVEYVLTNVDSANSATNVAFVHELAGLSFFTTTPPADGYCNGTGTASFSPSFNPPPPSSFVEAKTTFSGMSLAAGASCTFTLDYLVPDDFVAGSYQFSTAAISALVNSVNVESASPSASIAFSVEAAPKLSFSYSPAAVGQGGATSLDFKLTHGAGSSANATDIGFTIDLATVLPNISVNSLPEQPCGVGSTITGSTTLTMSGGTLGVAESCEFSVPVTVPADAAAGSYTFTSSVVDATVNGNSLSSPAATSDLQITNVTFSKSFSPDSLRIGNAAATTKVVYVINNADPVEAVSDIAFTELFTTIYSGVTVTSVTQPDVCGAGSSAIISGNQLILNGGTLDPSSSCSFEVSLNLPANMPVNTYSSSTSLFSATVDGINTSFDSISSQFTVNEITVLTSIDVTSPTSQSTISMDIEFSDAVENFDVNDIVVTNASLTNFVSTSSTLYAVDVMPTTDGTVTLNIPAGVADDVLDNNVTNTAAFELSFDYQSVVVTPTPSLTISAPSVLLASSGPVTFDVDYLDVEQVNLTASNVTLNTTGDASADITIIDGDSSNAQVSLSNLAGEGSIGISIAAGTARFSTNSAPAAGPSGVFAVDTNAPSVTLSGPSGIQSGDFVVDIVFNENVLGFDQSDIAIVNGTIESFNAIDAQNYQITVSATGTLDVDLSVAASSAQDAAGNGNTVSNTLVISFDDEAPSVTISGPTGDVASSFTATFTFSEDVTGFTKDDISVNNADLGTLASSDAKTYSIGVTPTVQAAVTLDVAANVAIDGANNGNLAATQYAVNYDFNDAPIISGSPAISVFEDSAYSFAPTYSDADALDTLVFSIVNKPSWASFSTSDGSLTGTPTNSDVGLTSSIVITLSDGALSASLAAFDIEVINSNDAPVISGTPLTSVNEGELYNFVPGSSDDDVGDSLTFSIVNKPAWAIFSSADGSLSGTPTNADVGITTNIVISVSDGTVTVPLPSFNITVVNVNEAPTITGVPASSVNQGSLYSFTPIANDGDAADSLQFSIQNKPSWASFNSEDGTLSGTPNNEDVGVTSNIIISVSDGELSASLDPFSIEVVNVNSAPVISGTPLTVVEQGQNYHFMPTATDEDGDTLSFTVVNLPSWSSFDVTTGAISGTPMSDDIGITTGIVISVSDGVETASLAGFNIEVVNVNDAPVISGIAPSSVLQGEVYSFTPTVNDDDENEEFTFSIVNKPQWAMFDTQLGTLSGTPDNDDVGVSADIQISVTDKAGESDSLAAFSIEVVNVNDAPVFTSTPVTEIVAEQAYQYQLSAEDVDAEHTLVFSMVSGPNWLSVSAAGLVQGTAPASAIGETFVVVLGVTDGEIEAPITQEYSLRVIAPDETTLSANLYFSPAPTSTQQAVSLIVELNNTGLTNAESVMFDVVLSDSITVTSLPAECTVQAQTVSCQLEDSLSADNQYSAALSLGSGEDSGFVTAVMSVTATNIGDDLTAEAQLLIADSLAVIPGEIVSSVPTEVGTAIDINGDGNVDLISFNPVNSEFEIRVNDGLGHLVFENSIDALSPATAMLVADINGDGQLDIVGLGGNNGVSRAYMLDQQLTVSSMEVLDAISADFAVVADLSNDGNRQLILAGVSQAEIAVYTGIGSGNTVVELVNLFDLILSLGNEQPLSEVSVNEQSSSVEASSSSSFKQLTSQQGISSVANISSTNGEQLLLVRDGEAPIIATYTEQGWQAEVVTGLPNGVSKFITGNIDGNEQIDGFVYHDSRWTMVIDIFSGTPQLSTVNLPQASDIKVTDLEGDGVVDLVFISAQGVSVWHYYGINDIRSSGNVIAGVDIVDALLMDVDADGDLDVITLDAQQGMGLWYLTSNADFGAQDVDISLFAQAPNFPQADQAGPVEFIVSNNSLGNATQVALNVDADSGITLSQLPAGCSLVDTGMSCNLNDLANGQQQSVTVWVTTANTGSYQLSGRIDSAETDTNPENNTVTVSLLVPEKPKQSSSSGSLSWYLLVLLSLLSVYRLLAVRQANRN
ncbi:putative Ig domain-containing protein [Shewanella waksmanii]|uniref:DUF7933 domain-containing protein n=1 Tax=Shewanella waksmanii TaxID=213783 RepID=UPI003736F651